MPINVRDSSPTVGRKSGNQNRAVAVSGWPLKGALALDAGCHGFLGSLTTAPVIRRQVIFAALSTGVADNPTDFLNAIRSSCIGESNGKCQDPDLGRALLNYPVATIIQAAFGNLPAGMLPALRRFGDQPLSAAAYALLHSICVDPIHDLRRKVLGYISPLTETHLQILADIHPTMLHVNALRLVRSPEEMKLANGVIDLVLEFSSLQTPATIMKAVSDLGPDTRLREWLTEMLCTFDRAPMPPPWPGTHDIVPLETGAALRQAGLRHRNCLATRFC